MHPQVNGSVKLLSAAIRLEVRLLTVCNGASPSRHTWVDVPLLIQLLARTDMVIQVLREFARSRMKD